MLVYCIKSAIKKCEVYLNELHDQLRIDHEQFKDKKGLIKLAGITVYALGAPGVSVRTDEAGTLMTYYFEPGFFRIYNHFHHVDIILKFGDREFLSGTNLQPRISTHKAVEFTTQITDKEVSESESLPFPGITKRIMAAHNKQIYRLDESQVSTTIVDINQSKILSEKFGFSSLSRFLYNAIFSLGQFIASIKLMVRVFPTLYSWSAHEITKPDVADETQKDKAAQKIQLAYKYYKLKNKQKIEKIDEKDVDDQRQSRGLSW